MADVEFRNENGVLWITLNRPEQMGALTSEMRERRQLKLVRRPKASESRLADCAAQEVCCCLVLLGAGGKQRAEGGAHAAARIAARHAASAPCGAKL